MPTASMAPPGGKTSTGPTMSWGPNGQMMQFPMPPMGSSSAPACSPNAQNTTSGPKQDGPAQQQLNRLLKEMMKEEDNLSPPPTIHCPRDPKAGREEQHQELVFGCSCIGGCQARVARGRECSCPNVVTMEDISTAVRCEMARVRSQLSGVRKRSSAGCASCTICGEAGSEGFRPGLQARTSWQRWTLHHLRQRRYGRPSWRERPESPRRHELHCDQLEELSSTANGDAVNASAALPFGVAGVV